MNSKKIRLFVDAHCFDQEYQGSRTFVKEIYKLLAQKKDLLIHMAAYDPEKLKEHFPDKENIVFLKYKNKSGFLRLAYDIPRLIKKHQVDFAHFQYITPLVKNCKQVVTIHDVIFSDYPNEFSYPYRLLKRLLYKRSACKADILTTVSAFSSGSIQKHLTNKSKVHIIRNGVSEHFFEPFDKGQCKILIKEKYGFDKFILYVSRIEPRKNHLALLNAYLHLELYKKGYHLACIGHETTEVPGLKKTIQSLPLSIRQFLFFNHSICDADLRSFYRAADVFIYPSKAEGFGIPPLEAGASRVPVICSNTSAMKEFSFFGSQHIDPCDEEVMQTKLAELIDAGNDQEKLEEIAQTIKEEYSWERSAEKLYHLLTTDNT